MNNADVPRIDSVWRARDGRRFRVLGSKLRGIEPDTHIGILLYAVEPIAPRQRRMTEMNAANFGPGLFMQRDDAGWWKK